MSVYPGCPLRGSEPYAVPRFHLPLIEPDVRICRIRLSDGIRPAAHGPTRRPDLHRRPSPFRRRRIVGWRFEATWPLSRLLTTSRTLPKSGPFPPPALPGFGGTTSLSATPHGPACCSRASGWRHVATAGASRVAFVLLCRHAVATTPAGPSRGSGCSPVLDDGGLPH